MGLLEFANSVLPDEDQKPSTTAKPTEKPDILAVADEVLKKEALPKKLDILDVAEEFVPSTPQGVIEKMAPRPLAPEGFTDFTPQPQQTEDVFSTAGRALSTAGAGIYRGLAMIPSVATEISKRVFGKSAEDSFTAGLRDTLLREAQKLDAQGIPVTNDALMEIVRKTYGSIGSAAAAIPIYAAAGPAGMATIGGLEGLAQGGIPGAVQGALQGAAAQGALGTLGQAPLGLGLAGAGVFGAVTTPGDWSEKLTGALTMMGLHGTMAGKTPTWAEFKQRYAADPTKAAIKFINAVGATPEEVQAAGGPLSYVQGRLKELADAVRPMVEPEPAVEQPGTFFSQGVEKPESRQLVIPGAEPPIERPEPFRPARMEGQQGVLPMPDASPLFQGVEPIETKPTGPEPQIERMVRGETIYYYGRFPGQKEAFFLGNNYDQKLQGPDRDTVLVQRTKDMAAKQGGETLFDQEVPSHAGQGGWSPEALERGKRVRFFIYDTRTGETRPIIGVEAVDIQPKPGEIKFQLNPKTNRAEVVDAGQVGNLKASRQQLQALLTKEGVDTGSLFDVWDQLRQTEGAREQAALDTAENYGREGTNRLARGKERAESRARAGLAPLKKSRYISQTEERAYMEEKARSQAADIGIDDIEAGRKVWAELDEPTKNAVYLTKTDDVIRSVGGDLKEAELVRGSAAAEEQVRAEAQRDKIISKVAGGKRPGVQKPIAFTESEQAPEPEQNVTKKAPVPGDVPAPLIPVTSSRGKEAPILAKTAMSATEPKTPESIPAPLGRAPKTVDELKSEIVRINKGKVTTEMADALMTYVRGFARYMKMTPDEYVQKRFGELLSEELPPAGPSKILSAEYKAQVIADCHSRGITDHEMIEKVLNGEPIASVEFLNDGKAIVRAFRKSNIAGMAHELGHIFRRDLKGPEKALVEKALHVSKTGWDRYAEERWAKQFELYLKHGTAPNPELNGVYAKFKRWIGDIYKEGRDIFNKNYRLNPEVRRVLDSIITGEPMPEPKAKGVTERAAGADDVGAPPAGGSGGGPKRPGGKGPAGPTTPQEGPTVEGKSLTPGDEVVARLTDAEGNERPNAMGITKSMVEKGLKTLAIIPPKLRDIIKNPIYFFEKVPFLKKHLYDKKVDADARFARAIEGLHTSIKGWTKATKATGDKNGERIWTYAIAQQEGGMKVLEQEGITQVPELTPEEMGVYKEVRKSLDDLYGRINEARALLGLAPIGKIQNYFTFLRKLPEMEANGFDPILNPDARLIDEAIKNPTNAGFMKHRGRGKAPLERNFYKVYEHYFRRANQYIEDAPIIAAAKLFTKTLTYKNAEGKNESYSMKDENPHVAKTIMDWVNFSTGHRPQGWIADILSEHPRAIRWVQGFNRNLAAGILSANIRSALVQPSSLRNTYIELGPRWLAKGAAHFLERGGRSDIMKLSKVLHGREFDVHAAAVAEGPTGRWDRVKDIKWRLAELGITPLKMLDMFSAQVTFAGAYAKATAAKAAGGLGLSGEEAVRFADDVVTKTQASAAPRDVAPIQRSLEGKLLGMFQTFVINEWNYLGNKVVGDMKTQKGFRAKYTAAFNLVLATAVVNAIFEDAMKMRSPFPAPEYALREGLKRGDKLGALLTNMGKELGEQIPIVGGGFRWSTEKRVAVPAPVQTYEDLFRLYGKTNAAIGSGDFSKFKPEDLSAPFKVLGIPSTSQAEKTMRRLQQGGSFIPALMGQKVETMSTGAKKSAAAKAKAKDELLKKYGYDQALPTTPRPRTKKRSAKSRSELLKKYGYSQ